MIYRFDLKNRIILTFSNLDERFVIKYFQRHDLRGIEYFAFYNFKHEIIGSSFSEGNITKDNLCKIYGIDNVENVHSGINDCKLEWLLYKSMNGNRLLITDNKVFEFNEEYFVPASFISSYPNLKYYLPKLPIITYSSRIVFSLPISMEKMIRFPTNFNGMILEHLINSMLHVHTINSMEALIENKKRLKYLGTLPSKTDIVPMVFNDDGSMTATRPQDKKLENAINSFVNEMKKAFEPLIGYIKDEIFSGQTILSQELILHQDHKILALCDLSDETAVLEIKANDFTISQKYADQLFFEANGRKAYILLTDWSHTSKTITYNIHEVVFDVREYVDPKASRFNDAKRIVETDNIELVSFVDQRSPVKLKCRKCGHEWTSSFYLAKQQRPCPNCTPKSGKSSTDSKLSEKEESIRKKKEKEESKFHQFNAKLSTRSNNTLIAISYVGSNLPARARCLICGHEWEARADHLLARPFCPSCRRYNRWVEKRQ